MSFLEKSQFLLITVFLHQLLSFRKVQLKPLLAFMSLMVKIMTQAQTNIGKLRHRDLINLDWLAVYFL